MNEETQLIISALQLSEGINKNFDELELSNISKLSVKKIRNYLSNKQLPRSIVFSKKSKIVCPNCKNELDYEGIDSCPICDQSINIGNVPIYSLGIMYEKAKADLSKIVETHFNGLGAKKTLGEHGFSLFEFGGHKVALLLSIDANLDQYYSLKGWTDEKEADIGLLLSFQFDVFIHSLATKAPKFMAYALTDFFKKNKKDISSDFSYKIKLSEDLEKLEDKLGVELEDYGEICSVGENLKTLISDLPTLALQQSVESHSKQGNLFQKSVVSLLNLTIFSAEGVGGNNAPDGIVFLYGRGPNEKSKCIPLDVKSYKGTINDPYPLKEAMSQIKKYTKAFGSEIADQQFYTIGFLVVAFDFDVKKDKPLLEEFRREFGIPLILLPIRSLVRILNNFSRGKVAEIPNKILEKFLISNTYISEKEVDILFEELERYNKNKNKDLLKRIRADVAQQGL